MLLCMFKYFIIFNLMFCFVTAYILFLTILLSLFIVMIYKIIILILKYVYPRKLKIILKSIKYFFIYFFMIFFDLDDVIIDYMDLIFDVYISFFIDDFYDELEFIYIIFWIIIPSLFIGYVCIIVIQIYLTVLLLYCSITIKFFLILWNLFKPFIYTTLIDLIWILFVLFKLLLFLIFSFIIIVYIIFLVLFDWIKNIIDFCKKKFNTKFLNTWFIYIYMLFFLHLINLVYSYFNFKFVKLKNLINFILILLILILAKSLIPLITFLITFNFLNLIINYVKIHCNIYFFNKTFYKKRVTYINMFFFIFHNCYLFLFSIR